jgi:hypothetical protein
LTRSYSTDDFTTAHRRVASNQNRRLVRFLPSRPTRDFVLLLIGCLSSVSSAWADAGGPPIAETIRITSTTYGFGLALPAGWTTIPIGLFNQQLVQSAVSQLAPQMKATAAFQRGPERRNIERPFCVVTAVPTGWPGGPTPEQFALVIKAMSADDKVLEEEWGIVSTYTPAQVADLRTMFASTSRGSVHAYPAARRFWRVVDGAGSSGEALRTLTSSLFLTNGNMISLNCYSNRAEFARDVDDFAAITRSLRELRQ